MIVVCIEAFSPIGFNTVLGKEIEHQPNELPVVGKEYHVVDMVDYQSKIYYVLFEFPKDNIYIHDHFREVDINISDAFVEETNYVGT